MIQIDENTVIDERFIETDFVRSSGPGGQHVNKTSTAVQLRFDVRNCDTLSEEVKRRLENLAGRRMTLAGELVIDARRFRSQEQNRRDALERLVLLIAKAAQPVKVRGKRKPSASSRKRRLEEKRRRGDLKKSRGNIPVE
jgi:ribosome-associated protein